MAQPTAYNRQFNFANEEAENPTSKTPGDELDQEFNAVKLTTDQIRANLALIQRDDGALANNSVGSEQLSPDLSIGFTLRGPWAEDVNYVLSDGVSYDSKLYRALSSHLSTALNSPTLDSTKWELLADLTAAALGNDSVTNAVLANMPADTVKMNNTGVTADPVDVNKTGFKTWLALTGADITFSTPSGANDAATKDYVDDIEATIGLKHISSGTVSGVANVDIPLPSGYESFELELTNVILATSGQILYLRPSIDNGSSYPSSSYRYANHYLSTGAAESTAASGSGAGYLIGPTMGNSANGVGHFTIEIPKPKTAGIYKLLTWRGAALDASAVMQHGSGSGWYAGSTDAWTHIRLVAVTSNISLTWALRGRRI